MLRLTRILRLFAIAAAQIVLIALIIGLLLANWMPAIYQSEWFQARFKSSDDQQTTDNR